MPDKLKGLQSHLARGRVNGSLKYRTLCGRVVSVWSIVYWKPKYWWNNCKTCRTIIKAKGRV